MAETQTPTVAEERVNTQDLNQVKDWFTGEPIGTRTAKAFKVRDMGYSWDSTQVIFVVWDDNTLDAIMNSPAMKVMQMIKTAQENGEQVAIEDLPTTNGRPLLWNGYAVLEGEELTRTLAKQMRPTATKAHGAAHRKANRWRPIGRSQFRKRWPTSALVRSLPTPTNTKASGTQTFKYRWRIGLNRAGTHPTRPNR